MSLADKNAQVITALTMAIDAHAGQTDKQNYQYILHPLRVGASFPDDQDAQIVGFLHDAIEDTDLTLDELAFWFDRVDIDALDAITRRPGETYFGDYLPRVRANALATKVKLADALDNLHRVDGLPGKSRRTRAEKKYREAVQYLKG